MLQGAASSDGEGGEEQSAEYAGGHWKLTEKHYFNQVGSAFLSFPFCFSRVQCSAGVGWV